MKTFLITGKIQLLTQAETEEEAGHLLVQALKRTHALTAYEFNVNEVKKTLDDHDNGSSSIKNLLDSGILDTAFKIHKLNDE